MFQSGNDGFCDLDVLGYGYDSDPNEAARKLTDAPEAWARLGRAFLATRPDYWTTEPAWALLQFGEPAE
ncbi:hypothetical protein ACFSQT_11995 [Mesorhizobium calcicola]|uniref:Uncharacterized protein n=1 Tax=Mesorhizobium calcicola TaxID=1300310 RepID=A0ABW4WAU8_9HYPH